MMAISIAEHVAVSVLHNICRLDRWFGGSAEQDTVKCAHISGVPRGRGFGGSNPPPPEIPKSLKNRA